MTTDEQRVTQLCDELLAKLDPKTTPAAEFLGAQYDLGLALGALPRRRRRSRALAEVAEHDQRKAVRGRRADPVRRATRSVHGMCAPTIVTHGSDEQKQRYLRPLFTGEEIWCQMFSEPGAGSDVAGLSTRAIRDGDEWVLNGQKVWTTLAHVAAFGIVLARTDPEQVKHKGMTMFVIDMHAPGVEVRPLVQATGDAEFNEVYMTDVRIPDTERLGDIGEGWGVSLTTLMNERVSIGGQVNPRGSGVIAVAVNEWKQNVQRQDAVARDELVQLWTDAEVNRLTNMRASQSRRKGTPGPEGSVGKLAMAGLNQRIMSFVMDLMGPDAMLYPSGYTFERPRSAMDLSNPQKAFLRVQANSIEGGTTNIMKNILGERVLGLPGEPRPDKGLPWSQVPRS